MRRRDLIRGAAGAAAFLSLPTAVRDRALRSPLALSDLDVALGAERWIRASRIKTADGVTWPSNPLMPNSVSRDLYSGAPGVVLFYLELHHATGDKTFLDEAKAGADDLFARLPDTAAGAAGLYTGVAGSAFAIAETWRATKDESYLRGARKALTRIHEMAKKVGSGVEWNDSTDIISGASGTTLFLLYAARVLDDKDAVALASSAARRLIERGQPSDGGLKWMISPSVPNHYPNFSHGGAGVSYTLASVYAVTREKPLLDAALSGVKYLDAVAEHRGTACKVFHHEPDGRDLYYLSWCHGGPGTARLFQRLHAITGEKAWRDKITCYANGVTEMGAPVGRSPGYWNNISQCCGNAGVGEFFLSLDRLEPNKGHLAVARRAADDILAKATSDNTALKWIQAEHRVRPELLIAQTGLMQGAAGVGLFFLRLDARAKGRTPRVVLPDTPFI